MSENKKPDVIARVEWDCPVCGKKGFKSPEEAVKCRDSHLVPDRIIKCNYAAQDEFPLNMVLIFPDGFKATAIIRGYFVEGYGSCTIGSLSTKHKEFIEKKQADQATQP